MVQKKRANIQKLEGRANAEDREGERGFFAHFINDLLIMTPIDSCVRQAKWQYFQKAENNCNLFSALDSPDFKKRRL